MLAYEQYKPENLVHSIVFYEWTADFDLFSIRDLFEDMIKLIGQSPDIGTVGDFQGGKDYFYPNFSKKNVLTKKKWGLVAYSWKRVPDNISQFSIVFSCDPYDFKYFAVLIDDAAVEDIKKTMLALTDLLTARLCPIYGIGYIIPYKSGPRWIVNGNVCDGTFENDQPYKATTSQICGRSRFFKPVYLNRGIPSILQNHIRDIYEVNFLSQGHLDYRINGITFRQLVDKKAAGTLTQLNEITWRWDIPGEHMERIRDDLIRAGMMIVTA